MLSSLTGGGGLSASGGSAGPSEAHSTSSQTISAPVMIGSTGQVDQYTAAFLSDFFGASVSKEGGIQGANTVAQVLGPGINWTVIGIAGVSLLVVLGGTFLISRKK